MYGELSKAFTDLMRQNFPQLTDTFGWSAKARVISTDRDKGVATIHPLTPEGVDDELSPDVPNVPLPVIPTPSGPACIVPEAGELVRMLYYYNDPSQPKITECLGKGYIYGDMHWTSRDENAHISITGADIHAEAKADAAVLADNDLTLKAGSHSEIGGTSINIG